MTRLTQEQLLKLKDSQIKLAALKETLKLKQEVFNQENEGLINAIEAVSDEITLNKIDIKTVAEAEYSETFNKKLLGGIGIRVGVTLNYLYENAYKWAQEHNLCLTLDIKGFEALAKTQPLPFVTKEEKITVTFPKELTI